MAWVVRGTNKQEKQVYKVLESPDKALADTTQKHCERGTSPEEWAFDTSQVPMGPGVPEFNIKWLTKERAKEDWPDE